MTVGVPSLTISPETLDDAPGAQPYTATFVAAGGIGDYTYALQSGALPAGLAIAEDGSLTGTPTQYGTFEFTVIATDEEGFTGTRAYTLTVVSPELALSAKFLNGTSGTDYPSTTVSTSGGSGPYTYSITGGKLPTGLTLSNGGVISGRPTGSGRSSFSVTSVDAGGATVTAEYSITIRSAAPAPAPTISLAPGVLPDGDQGVAYRQVFTATGGTAAYTFTLSGGLLPAGLTLASDGTLSGTPTEHGTFNFVVAARDSNGFAGNKDYVLFVGTTFIQMRTSEVNRSFMSHRADVLTSQGPNRLQVHNRFGGMSGGGSQMSGGGNVPFSVGMTGGDDDGPTKFSFATSLRQMMQASNSQKFTPKDANRMALGGADAGNSTATSGQNFDFWVEGNITHFRGDETRAKGDVTLLYVGADYLVTPGLLIGALIQFDRMDETSKAFGSEVSGHGWMAGPYMSARLTPNLFFDARAAWGKSDNQTSPFGTYTDNFDTTRWLAKADMTGNWEFGAWRFTPSAGLSYYEDEQDSYVDSNGITIASETVSLGRFTFGPEFGYRFQTADGSTIEPFVGLQGIWDFDRDAAVVNGIETGGDEVRAKGSLGLSVISPWGYTIRGVASYDGIGSDDYEAISGQLWVNMPLN